MVNIGIIICDRYGDCAGGKCFRSLREREGAFEVYEGKEVQVVGYADCGGCPGRNIQYAPNEMKQNDAEVIHLATGLLVGYPPCPSIDYFKNFIEEKYGLKVVLGTHPVPQSYYDTHKALGTWDSERWEDRLKHVLVDEVTRRDYD